MTSRPALRGRLPGCLFLLLLPLALRAADITVGGTPISIPSPAGFAAVTRQMPALYLLQKQFVAPMNEEFVGFIQEALVPGAPKNEVPELPRRFTVQVSDQLVAASVPTADFAKIKALVRSQNAQLFREVERKLPGVMKQMNEWPGPGRTG